jgi:RimJ/RimL family protein N-acetyltransferase
MTADDPITLANAWPLFGLRIRSERLVLRLPTDDDLLGLLALARAGMHPPEEMPFGIAWSTAPSPAFERGFMQHHWGMRSSWTPESWYLNLMIELDGRPIGSQSMHGTQFATMRTVDTGSWLGRPHQGQGYGREMRAAVLAFAFDGLGARVALTEAFLDNAASNGVSRSLGYEENGRGALAPEGVARETQRFRMTAERWWSRPRPSVEIDGLDRCLPMFGVGDAAKSSPPGAPHPGRDSQ